MARETAWVLAGWGKAPGGDNVPLLPTTPPTLAVAANLPGITSVSDVTEQAAQNLPPSPNLCVVEVQTDTSYLDTFDQDAILWREEVG